MWQSACIFIAFCLVVCIHSATSISDWGATMDATPLTPHVVHINAIYSHVQLEENGRRRLVKCLGNTMHDQLDLQPRTKLFVNSIPLAVNHFPVTCAHT